MMHRRLFIGGLFLLFILVSLPAMAQDAPPQLNSALADLSAKLARTITASDLDGYSYDQLTFPDARLGCPIAPAPSNSATNIAGYLFRLTLAGVIYDYRVSADSRIVVACDSTLQQITPPPPPSPPPTVATTACPPNFAGYLAPQVQLAEEARVTAGVEPNRLRPEPSLAAAQIGILNPGTTFLIIGGPSCGDGFVWWQVQAGDQTGWMAEGALPNSYYIEPTGVRGSGIDFPEVAAVTQDMLRFYQFDYDDELSASIDIEMPPLSDFDLIQSSAWSPDGSLFAFVLVSQDIETKTVTRNLYIMSFFDDAPILVAEDIYEGLPISFTDDVSTNTLLYPVAAGEPFTSDDPSSLLGSAQRVSIVSQSLTPRADPLTLGTVDYGVGCGGGGDSAADTRYQSEVGYDAHGGVLQSTPYGIVYTSNCTGSGTALLDPESGEWVTLGFNLSRVSVSPDQSHIVGIEDIQPGADPGTLAVVDLQSGEANLISTSVAPAQVAWSDNATLYFSRSVGRGTGANDGNIALYRISADGAGETEVYSGEGYAIGRILTAPDGSLFFSVVSTDAAWQAALAGGEVATDVGYRARLRYAPVSLYMIGFDGAVTLLGEDLAQAALNDGAFIDVTVG